MKKLVLVILFIFINTGCGTKQDQQVLTKEITNNDCTVSSENFSIIKNRAELGKIIMGDWTVEFKQTDGSLSYQKSNEEIFVIFSKEDSVEIIPLGKEGFTNSFEEQVDLFCKTLTLIRA